MILVTGASGTVGSELVRQLQAAGARYKAAYHSAEKAGKARGAGIDAVVLDYDKPETLPPALKGADTVFLLSTLVAPELSVVREAKAAGVSRIVKQSVWGAGEEAFSFAKWHRPLERAIEESGLRWTFLRPNGFMQNVVNFMGATIKGQGAIYQPAGDARISHIDVRDLARVAVKVLTGSGHDGKAYELSGPAGITYGEVAATLSKVLGREVRYVPITPEQYKQGALGAGIPEPYADALVDLTRYYREGHASRVSPAVKEITGWEPIGFEQFARDHAAALR